ncbi:MAG: hypothetical protein J5509_10450 [Lachnospiraceae bacterium]|nr:hypothetical protein [Lachnospiraceae bacterium]
MKTAQKEIDMKGYSVKSTVKTIMLFTLSLFIAIGIRMIASPIVSYAIDAPYFNTPSDGANLPDGRVNEAYSYDLSVTTRGYQEEEFLMDGAPSGLYITRWGLDANRRHPVISGTPSVSGDFDITIRIRLERNTTDSTAITVHLHIDPATDPGTGGGTGGNAGGNTTAGTTTSSSSTSNKAKTSTSKTATIAAPALTPEQQAQMLAEYQALLAQMKAAEAASAHQHDYEWVETKPATENDNGEILYRCKGCGEVLYRLPLSAFGVFNQNAVTKITKAGQNATVEISTARWISFHKSVFDALAARPDVTLKINFLSDGYKGDPMSVTIPAGSDVSSLPDANGYAGFKYLAGIFGTTAQ